MLCSCGRFQETLAVHSAPALLGVKAACLMSIDKDELDVYSSAESFNRRAASKGLRIKILCECNKRCLLLLYNSKLMDKLLADPDRRRLLEGFGYSFDLDREQCLDRLALRCADAGDFPHEIGVFLDYPPEDVRGFIEHRGSNYKLCGYWKVYGDADSACRTFQKYDKCRRFLCNKLNEGMDIYQALRIS